MIDHMSIHVSDLDRSIAFYKAALAPLGYELVMQFPGVAGFGEGGNTDFWLGAGGPVSSTNHVAFHARTRKLVDAFHAAALAAGGKDNGAPGVRAMYHPDYYGAFVHDPDGHNIEAVCHEAYLG
ncbi:MAG: VOC family protein [Kofleriaceae bacterium]|nr:VOC family protein [Kofleriaceae bacterium]